MEGYLGEFDVILSDSKFKNHSKVDWILYFIESYGWIDGADHKDWLLDQIVRIINDTPIIIKEARWANGEINERVSLGEPTVEYWEYIKQYKHGEDGPNTYGYEFGISP